MPKIAIIGGSIISNFRKRGVIFLNRHEGDKPPHKINHKNNILSLKKKGAETIIGVCSVGSLKKSIKPGSTVVPDDYINFFNIQTFYNNGIKHITPSLDEDLRKKIIKASKKSGLKIFNKGVYFQTIGPRLETRAEINMIKHYADMVGMTMGSEADLAKELGIKYAAICSVDNYANGVSKEKLNFTEIKKMQKRNKGKIIKLLNNLLKPSHYTL
jgi:5'-methylthioadenosine phosphorylase